MNALRSSFFKIFPLTPGVAYNWTCVSIVKLLMAEKLSNNGFMCSSSTASISQVEGVAVGVKSENVRWYVREYFMDRMVHLDRDAATLGANGLGLRSGGAELVESRCAIIACSSAKICLNVFAINVARDGVGMESEGIWFGV